MEIGSFLIILALLIPVIGFILYPLRETPALEEGENGQLSSLLAERERILEALSELDFDNELGKVPEELYPLQRTHLLEKGAAVLRQLDEHQPEIEASSGDKLEDMIAARKQAAAKIKLAKGNFCPECGGRTEPGDKFCVSCGIKLTTKRS
jgi:hypothetical protein